MYLGLFKHKLAWDCLHDVLKQLLPRRYLFEPRFQLNERTGTWEYLSPETVDRVLSLQGWKGLKGTIAPDIVIMDEHGVIVRVYDMKFPCPESNATRWETYMSGQWFGQKQGDIYAIALNATPLLVSPREGIVAPPR